MDLKIRLAKKSDLKNYTDLLQRTFQESFVSKKIGLTKECFSKEVFESKNTQDYLKSCLVVNNHQKTWLAFLREKLIGSITITNKAEDYKLGGFYVDSKYQGQGIGKKLFQKVLDFTKDKNIFLETYSHNKKTIKIYQRWGFKIDKNTKPFFRHWVEWPEGVKVKVITMRLYK